MSTSWVDEKGNRLPFVCYVCGEPAVSLVNLSAAASPVCVPGPTHSTFKPACKKHGGYTFAICPDPSKHEAKPQSEMDEARLDEAELQEIERTCWPLNAPEEDNPIKKLPIALREAWRERDQVRAELYEQIERLERATFIVKRDESIPSPPHTNGPVPELIIRRLIQQRDEALRERDWWHDSASRCAVVDDVFRRAERAEKEVERLREESDHWRVQAEYAQGLGWRRLQAVREAAEEARINGYDEPEQLLRLSRALDACKEDLT